MAQCDRKGSFAVEFVQEGIPPEFLSHYVPTEPFAFHSISDWLSDAL